MTEPVIFVIDDDPSVCVAIRRLLLSLNLPIRLFDSAEQFLEQIPLGTRGCLILDVRLPAMTGLQLQKKLNTDEWALPVVIVTADENTETKQAAMELGAIAYLRKPFDRNELLKSVRSAI